MLLTRECLPMLRQAGEAGGGLVVNMASIAGKAGRRRLAAYSATKAGMVAFTQVLLAEHGQDGIRATALCPGLVATPMTEPFMGAIPKDDMISPGTSPRRCATS